MTQQAVQAQRRPEPQRRINLRLSRLPYELHCQQQQHARDQARLAAPQPTRKVVDKRNAAQSTQQGREQEGRSQRISDLDAEREQPEERGRLVGVDVAAHARQQPVASHHHVAGNQGKSRLVCRPGVPQPDAGSDEKQSETQ